MMDAGVATDTVCTPHRARSGTFQILRGIDTNAVATAYQTAYRDENQAQFFQYTQPISRVRQRPMLEIAPRDKVLVEEIVQYYLNDDPAWKGDAGSLLVENRL